MKHRLFRLLPFITILAACAVFFYPTITKGLLPAPTDTIIGLYHPWLDQAAITNPAGVPFKNFLITDPIRQQIPWRKLVIDNFKKGTLPVWNPYNFSGTPLLANIQAGTWYPLNIFFFLFPFYAAWTALIIAQPILAAFFLYFYVRSKKVVRPVAVLAGIVWAFCGFSIAWLTWGTIVQTALWLPLILLAIDKMLDGREPKTEILWAAILAVSSASALFAGHIQVAVYIFIFAGAYGLFGLWNTPHRKNVWWLLTAVVAGGIITSVQWLPLIQLLQHSSRLTDTAAWIKDGWFLPWQNLVQFVVPDFFGNPATLNYWGIWNYGEFIGYIGILPLMLAVYGVITRRDRLTRFVEAIGIIVLLLLLPTPIAKLPYQFHLPVISSLQPTRLMVLADFCLVMLAALGLDAYVKNPRKKILVGVVCIGIILGSLWFYVIRMSHISHDVEFISHLAVSRRNLMLPSVLWAVSSTLLLLSLLFKKRGIHLFILLIISVTVFDLFRFGWKFTPFTPVEYFFPTTNAVSFLQSQPQPFRVMSLDNRIMPPNVNSYYGIESIEGYDPIYDARYEEFIAALNRREPNITPPFGFNRIITVPTVESPLVALLNVKYILTLDDVKSPDLTLVYREGNTRIYWYKRALPRIYPVESVRNASSKQEAISLLYDKAFNPGKTAVVEEALTVPPQPLSDRDVIRITSYTGSSIVAASTLSEDHFVVIANMYDPNWRVTVDGVSVQTHRADYVFIGIRVPKGDHLITLNYE